MTARRLKLVGSNTTSTIIDSGNTNADNNFRYDSSLQGYIYNKDEEKSKHNFDQSDPYTMLCNELGIGEVDMSWMDDL